MGLPTTRQWHPPDIDRYMRRLEPKSQNAFWEADQKGYLVIAGDERGIRLDVLWRKWCRDEITIHICAWTFGRTATVGYGLFREDGLYEPLTEDDVQQIKRALDSFGVKTADRINQTPYYLEFERIPVNMVDRVCRHVRGHYGFGNAPQQITEYKREQLSPRLRFQVFKTGGYKCELCGRNTAEDDVKLEVDHIIPVSRGGTSDPENLQVLCFDCNRGKSDQLL
jgi:hypothetical protein